MAGMLKCKAACQRRNISWCTWETLLTQPSHLGALDLRLCVGVREREKRRERERSERNKAAERKRVLRELKHSSQNIVRQGWRGHFVPRSYRRRLFRVHAECLLALPCSVWDLLLFPPTQLLFQLPKALSCMSMAWFQICLGKHSSAFLSICFTASSLPTCKTAVVTEQNPPSISLLQFLF